jgi:hypothetical protein
MKIKKLIAILLLTVVTLTSGAPRSYADDVSAEQLKKALSKKPVAAGYIVGGVAGTLVLGAVLYWALSRDSSQTSPQPFMPMTSSFDDAQSKGTIRHGFQCPQTLGSIALACW